MQNKTILLVGGDARQKELFNILKQKDYSVFSYGLFENEENVFKSDIIILPYPSIKDGFINAPFSKLKISIEEIVKFLKPGTKIFGGVLPQDFFKTYYVYDYAKNENLLYINAAITAESAISIAIENSKISLINSKILITGFGRIAKILSKFLTAFNCNITIVARKETDRALAKTLGCNTICFNEIKNHIPEFDFVFNTVPNTVFFGNELTNANKDTLFIELASKPGGFYSKDGINYISALALPGKYAPKTAGRLIFETIRPYLNKEEKTWKT